MHNAGKKNGTMEEPVVCSTSEVSETVDIAPGRGRTGKGDGDSQESRALKKAGGVKKVNAWNCSVCQEALFQQSAL